MAYPHGIPAHELTEEDEDAYEANELAKSVYEPEIGVGPQQYMIGIDMANRPDESHAVALDHDGKLIHLDNQDANSS